MEATLVARALRWQEDLVDLRFGQKLRLGKDDRQLVPVRAWRQELFVEDLVSDGSTLGRWTDEHVNRVGRPGIERSVDR